MFLFLRRLKIAFEKIFGFSFLVGIVVVLFMFSGAVFLNVKKIHAFYYVYQGDDYSEKEEYNEAINSYRKALEIFPAHVKARYNLGNIYVAYEDYDMAIKEYKTALFYDPEYINARINLGLLLAEQKLELDEAIEEYRKAVEIRLPLINIPLIYNNRNYIQKEKAIAYYNMGLAYRDKSLLYNQDSVSARELLLIAAESYKKSIELNPNSYESRYNLALTYHLLDMYSEAVKGYCKAMLIAPLNYEAYYNMAVLLKQKGRFNEAAEEFEKAGNLSSIEGDSFKAAFIYRVLNEVSAAAIAQHGFENEKVLNRLHKTMGKEAEDIYDTNSRILTVQDLEKSLLARIKTSSVCKSYIEENGQK